MDNNPPKQPILPNENVFNDYDKINDILLCLKSLLSDYTTFIIESSNQELANKLISIQKEVYQIQREVFDVMYSKGWYPLKRETPEKIQKIVQEYITKEAKLA
ncbi:spore coat protein [Thomasclavelia saccharogumia]|uniref:spore coat protein n=1 Tax=Thomasclavelia saccharogumia TaxID=341225 RepID=UPI00047964AE|nr:spore coat protein [Thomasclavelia saccharogumia]